MVKNNLFQWDQGQFLEFANGSAKYVDFSAPEEPSGIIRIELDNGLFAVPDSWLQTPGIKTAWVCLADDTMQALQFRIRSRPKPPTYVETPAHKITIDLLLERADEAVAAAELAAERAEAQLAEKGWLFPEIRGDGHLYIISENMDTLKLELQEGRLKAIYE